MLQGRRRVAAEVEQLHVAKAKVEFVDRAADRHEIRIQIGQVNAPGRFQVGAQRHVARRRRTARAPHRGASNVPGIPAEDFARAGQLRHFELKLVHSHHVGRQSRRRDRDGQAAQVGPLLRHRGRASAKRTAGDRWIGLAQASREDCDGLPLLLAAGGTDAAGRGRAINP